MRVTQNMLTNSNLGYISKNYNRLGKIMDQINTGKKITRPSDDPVIAMKGMRYRSQLVEVKQFYRNLTEGFTWLETSDSALEETGQILHRIRELTVQASNDSYDKDARANIAKEITQLQQHLVAMANTKVGDNYIFNGTNTDNQPVSETGINVDMSTSIADLGGLPDGKSDSIDAGYVISYQGQTYKFEEKSGSIVTFVIEPKINYNVVDDANKEKTKTETGFSATIKIDLTNSHSIEQTSLQENKQLDGGMIEVTKTVSPTDIVISKSTAVSTNDQDVEIEVMKGVTIPINVRKDSANTFAYSIELFSGIESIKKMLVDPETTGQDITKALDTLDKMQNNVISTRAELGARLNRVEMVEDRLLKQRIVAEQTVADNEDIDFEEAIINLVTQESIHRASLAAGARIIQPTLMDFLR
ncbi:MAG TPA: flagellar hook-associated protein FlgL [Bacillus bacterium]|nr:flagellar hook-associated protein FlgL [Bacillus sp. (in: firmicutes)]